MRGRGSIWNKTARYRATSLTFLEIGNRGKVTDPPRRRVENVVRGALYFTAISGAYRVTIFLEDENGLIS
jgi:hypothetical protein